MQHADQDKRPLARPQTSERRRKGSPMRAKGPEAAEPTEAASGVAARPVLEQLHHFADHMQGRAPSGPRGAGGHAPALVTREVLSAAADRLGLRILYEPRDLSALRDADFPCLVPLDDGTAWLATGLQNRSVLLVQTDEGIKAVPFKTFEARYSGLVLLLRSRSATEAQTGEDPSTERTAEPAREMRSVSRLARKILRSILAHNKARLMQLALAAVLSNLLLVALPLFIMSVYDRIIPHLAMETLWALGIGVLLALAIDLGLRVSRSSLLEAIATSVSNRYQGQFYARLLRQELATMPRMAGGLSGAIQEFDHLCRLVPQGVVAVLIDLPFFILLLGLLYYMGGAVVVAPVIGLFIIAVANIVTYARSREVNVASTQLAHKRANQLIETLGAIETVKSLKAENQLLARWERRTDTGAWLGYLSRHQTGFASHLTIITVQATIVLTLIIGVYELRDGGITMGALAASSLLVGRAMSPMGNLIALFVRGFHLLRSSGVVEQVLEAPQESAGDRQMGGARAFKGQISARSIGFGYDADQAGVLHNISFSIQPGERVGLIGRIGCGKSTLLKLIPRLYEANSGSLLLDGHDIRQYDPAFLRSHMALMPQESVLVEGTLRDNICLGLDEMDEAEFQRVCEIAGVQAFASTHPQGYGMPVGSRGEKLSGGERAAVVLARTLARRPRMLLLDEPTAAMDNDLERRIVAGLGDWLDDRTLVLATHRAPLLALVDRIIWLHEGRVIADGPREDVLANLRG